MALICILGMASCHAQTHQPAPPTTEGEAATVYMTTDISPEGLVRIYEALGVEAHGRVAVKISTGESSKSNHLRPELIKNLVQKVNGTLVECNTAYGGNRGDTEKHRQAIAERGYNDIATVDIMDEEGEMQLPVKDTKHLCHGRLRRRAEEPEHRRGLYRRKALHPFCGQEPEALDDRQTGQLP